MDGDDRQPEGMDNETPMERILEQMQRDSFSHAPGEEMTHVAGVSFVDDFGLSLGGMLHTVRTAVVCITWMYIVCFCWYTCRVMVCIYAVYRSSAVGVCECERGWC